MSTYASALVPIIVLILVGFGLRYFGLLKEEAWSGIERLTYFILFPALLIRSLGSQSLAGVPWHGMLVVISGTLFVAAITLIAFQRMRPLAGPATFTSIFQGGVRYNTYIVLAVAFGLWGSEGLALGSVAAGFMILQINLLCISAFAVWGKAAAKGIGPFIREVVRNPLILGCVVGWTLSLTGIGVPGLAGDILELIGRAALPLGLLAVGAALQPRAIPGHAMPILIASLIQFGLKPLTAALLASLTGLSGVAAGVVIMGFMTPTASSAYILARQLGGDAETMVSIITCQTLLAFLLMPLLAALLLA